jgi:hypothetical protein
LIEAGFCADHRHKEKVEEKKAQHEQLVQELRLAGWGDVQLHIMTFGVGGTTYKHNLTALRALGVNNEKARKCLRKIHLKSVEYAHRMIVARRQREREQVSRRSCSANAVGT